MSINAIKANMLAIQSKLNLKKEANEKVSNPTNQTTQFTQEKQQISADDVFKYMSATSNMPVHTRKSVNVKAYVDEESASRISNSMTKFEDEFKTKLSSVKSEFGNISNDLAEKITLLMF
ncbi:MAG: hypothetical protein ACI4SM_00970 [Candidatus Gastranaerophilaceae bacterium]